MSVSKVIRNPVGEGGSVVLAGDLTVNGAILTPTLFDAGGTVEMQGDLLVGQTGNFQNRVSISGQNSGSPTTAALNVTGSPNQTEPIALFRNGAGVVKAAILLDGSIDCEGAALITGNSFIFGPAIGGSFQGTYIDTNGLLQVSSLGANESLRLKFDGSGMENFKSTFLKNSGILDLSVITPHNVFTTAFDFYLTRVYAICVGTPGGTNPSLRIDTSGPTTIIPATVLNFGGTPDKKAILLTPPNPYVVLPAGQTLTATAVINSSAAFDVKLMVEGFYF